MKKLIVPAILFVILLGQNLTAQERLSMQINGGFLSPVSNSSNGLVGTVQLNFNQPGIIHFYIYSGFGAWDRTYFTYYDESKISNKSITDYSEANHIIIPLYAGARLFLHRNKMINLFVDGEAGLVFLSYTKYNQQRFVNPDGTIEYLPVSRPQQSETLFGLGAGVGISHELANKVVLLLEFKLNTNANSSYSKLFSTAGTSTTVQFGFGFNI